MYYPASGTGTTGLVVEKAVRRAKQLKLEHIVVASCSGKSAQLFLDQAKHFNIVCVTHQVGFYQPGEDEMTHEIRDELREGGIKVFTASHLMAGIDRACRIKFGGVYPAEITASSLRMFGQGIKVSVEVAVMALDAGMIPYGIEIISLGGTGHGLDTAVVIVPAHSQNFFDTKIKEIICKPRDF